MFSSSVAEERRGDMAKSFAFFVFVFLFLLHPLLSVSQDGETSEEEATAEDLVLVLDASNFTEVVNQHPFIVVEFYAPWCGHCKKLAPEYEKASQLLKGNEPPIVLAKVNADEENNKPLAAEYNVSGFPSLKIIENKGGKVRDYEGPSDASGIVAFLKKQTQPPSEELASVDQIPDLLQENDIVVVGVFEDYSTEEFSNFTKAAEGLRSNYEFKHTSDASLLPKEYVVPTAPAVRIFKTFDEGFRDTKDFALEALTKFLDAASLPLVTEFSRDPKKAVFVERFFSDPGSKVLLFARLNDDNADEYKKAYRDLASFGKGKGLKFFIADADAQEVDNALNFYGVTKDGIPVIIIEGMDDKKFLLENAEPSQLESWLQNYLDGKLVPHVKSDPIPEKNDEPVKVVVTRSLNDFLSSGKDVLLEFYAPWCGHCKTLVPTYEEIALHFQDDPAIIVAKMDGTTNDVPSDKFYVRGFPTIYLHSSSGVISKYDGDRSKDDIIKFVNEHRTAIQKEAEVKDEL